MQAETVDFSRTACEGVSDEFQKEILDHFRDNEIGNLCRKDKAILLLGQKLWSKSARKKRQSVMGEMRLMAKLNLEFRHVSGCMSLTGEDLLDRKYYPVLEQAIDNLSKRENGGKQKSGLKMSVGYLLKKLIKMIKGFYIQRDEMDKSAEVNQFSAMLDHNGEANLPTTIMPNLVNVALIVSEIMAIAYCGKGHPNLNVELFLETIIATIIKFGSMVLIHDSYI